MTTTSTPSKADTARQLFALDTTPGLPPLPHIPATWHLSDQLTWKQREANLLHVALWIVERDQENLEMEAWHANATSLLWTPAEQLHFCGTVHCIAGFAQLMSGELGFEVAPYIAGRLLLGGEAEDHFMDSNEEGLDFLKAVIADNS
jgi:hypothetical protein